MRKDKLGKAAVNRLFNDGAAAKARALVARALANGLAFSRFAAIAPRKVGTAVLRNRLKRRLRAAWIAERAALPPGYDFAVIARSTAADLDFPALREMFRTAVARAATEAPADGAPVPR